MQRQKLAAMLTAPIPARLKQRIVRTPAYRGKLSRAAHQRPHEAE